MVSCSSHWLLRKGSTLSLVVLGAALLSGCGGKIKSLESDVARLQEQVATLEQQNGALQSENTELAGQVSALEKQRSSLQEQVSALKNSDQTAFRKAAQQRQAGNLDAALAAFKAFQQAFPQSTYLAQARLNIQEIQAEQAAAQKKAAQEAQARALAAQGFTVSDVRSYWTAENNDGEWLLVPQIRFKIKNVSGAPIDRLIFKGNFVVSSENGDKEALGNGTFYAVGYGDTPLEPGYTKEVFMNSDTGYVDNGGGMAMSIILGDPPATSVDLYYERGDALNAQQTKLRTIKIDQRFQR